MKRTEKLVFLCCFHFIEWYIFFFAASPLLFEIMRKKSCAVTLEYTLEYSLRGLHGGTAFNVLFMQ